MSDIALPLSHPRAEFLRDKGVTAIVSLTEMPLDAQALGEWGFEYRHFPVPDGSYPAVPAMQEIGETICKLIQDGWRVAVHCAATAAVTESSWTSGPTKSKLSVVRPLRPNAKMNRVPHAYPTPKVRSMKTLHLVRILLITGSLLVVTGSNAVERAADLPREEMLRVLAPGGVAYVKDNRQWTKTVKPWPAEIDEWTHYLHDAGGNAVARDTRVGPPRHIQWMAAPIWTRNHHKLNSISSVVSAGGYSFGRPQ